MRLNKHHHAQTLGFNMTPMIDVVFLLIIFFMTVSQISRINAHHVQLPEVAQAETLEEPISVSLTIAADGQIFENGLAVSQREALVKVQQMLVRAGNDPSRLLVQIRCDRRATSKPVNELVRQFSSLGIKQVRTAIVER